MNKLYQVAFGPTPYATNMGDPVIVKLKLCNVGKEDVELALSRCSLSHALTLSRDTSGYPGFIVKITSSAPSMTSHEIDDLLEEMNTHLVNIKRAKEDRTRQAAASHRSK